MHMMEFKSVYEELIFTTVRIESLLKDGKYSTGTGFIVNYSFKDKNAQQLNATFLVTNKHVIKDATKGVLVFNKRSGNGPDLGNIHQIEIDNFESRFIGHKDKEIDIAVAPFLPLVNDLLQKINIYYKSIPLSLVPTQEQSDELDAVEDVLIIGYPNGLYDKKNCLPIVRNGITATHPNIDFEGKPIFIVDASIFPGSSGSPVFICNTGSYTKKGVNDIFLGSRLMLMGIIASVFVKQDENQLEIVSIPVKDIPIVRTTQMIDLGIVYKSRCIVEVIEDYLRAGNLLP